MTVLSKNNHIAAEIITSLNENISSLVGRSVDIISEFFNGRPLSCRVVMVSDGIITLDKNTEKGDLAKLVNNQDIIVQFVYNEQRLSVNATFYRSPRGRCNIKLGNKLVPLARRKFVRYKKSHLVKCASLISFNTNPSTISRLRWLESESVNISSGGALIPLPVNLNKDTFLMINLKADYLGFPNLIMGQVRHSTPTDDFNYNIGVQFIVNEEKEKYFPLLTIRRLPPKAFEYNNSKRFEIEKEIIKYMNNN